MSDVDNRNPQHQGNKMKNSITYTELGEILGEAFEDAKVPDGRLAILDAKNGFLSWSTKLNHDRGEYARNALQDAFDNKIQEIRGKK